MTNMIPHPILQQLILACRNISRGHSRPSFRLFYIHEHLRRTRLTIHRGREVQCTNVIVWTLLCDGLDGFNEFGDVEFSQGKSSGDFGFPERRFVVEEGGRG